MNQRTAIAFNAKIKPVKQLNDEFTLCKCYVMALDKNRNISCIEKESADAAMPTLFNIPVIGHLYQDASGNYHMGGHDIEIAIDEDGKGYFKSLCVPYGVVPTQDGVCYEDITEPNGDVHTYLVADVILWTGRFPELKEAIYDENTYFGQSMEINVTESEPLEEDKNYMNIKKYSYSALCLLGKSDNPDEHFEPCFPMSRVTPYTYALDDKFSELMEQLKSELSFCFEQDDSEKGGKEQMTVENRDLILSEYGLTADEIDFEIPDDMSEEDLRARADEFAKCKKKKNELTEGQKYSITHNQKRDALVNALEPTTIKDDNGITVSETDYWLCDFDDSYVYVERYTYTPDNYDSMNGRFGYTFDETTLTASLTGEFEQMIVKWLTPDENSQIESMRNEYQTLLDYKAQRIEEDRKLEYDAALDEFSDLAENEEFAKVCECKYDFASADVLREKCFAIRGKLATPLTKKKQNSEPVIPLDLHREDEVYGGFFTKYLKKNERLGK